MDDRPSFSSSIVYGPSSIAMPPTQHIILPVSRAESLYRLQLLDAELDATRKRWRELEGAIANNPAVNHTRTEHAKAQKAALAAASALKSLELDAKSLDAKIKDDEDRLYAGKIRNPKEMLDIERDLAQLKRRHAELDEQMLAAMETQDDARATEKNCEAALRQSIKKWEEDNAAGKQEMTDLQKKAQADLERRAAAVASITKPDIDLYAALRAKKNGVAVAIIKNGACSACGEQPSSQQLQQARTGAGVVQCATCGRILYGA